MKRACKKSNNFRLRRITRSAKKSCAAIAVASAVGALGLFESSASAATLTWTGTTADPNSALYTATAQGEAAGFVSGQNLYYWNASSTNWTGAYNPGDHVIFTDNFAGGTDIRLTSGNLNPASITFAHIAGSTPVTYRFLHSSSTGDFADFKNASGSANLGSASPFGALATTTLILDTGFLGKVVLRDRSNATVTTGNTIIRSGVLELGDGGALPHTANQSQPNVELAGGELWINVNTAGNTEPSSTQFGGTLTVSQDSILASNDQVGSPTEPTLRRTRVWSGPINVAAGKTLTFKYVGPVNDPTNNYLRTTANMRNSVGTFKLEDGPSGAGSTRLHLGDTDSESINSLWDLGTGSSSLMSRDIPDADLDLGALTGGPGTSLHGSSNHNSTTTWRIGGRGDSTTFAGTIVDGNTTTNVNALTAIVKVGAGTLTLTGQSTYTGATTVSGGTLQFAGATGQALFSPVTINNGGTLRLDNTTRNNNRIVSLPVTMNQGTFIFQGNLNPAGTAHNENTGALTIAGGGNVVQTESTGSGGLSPASITFTALARTAGVVDFRPDPANTTVIRINSTTLTNGILGGFATFNSSDWATMSGTTVAAYAAYTTDSAPGTWASTQNINLTTGATSTVAASATINSLRLAGAGTTVAINAGQTLNVGTGGVLSAGTGGASISGAGSLTAGSAAGAELIVNVGNAANTMTISAPIADNGVGAVALVKAGPGKLILSGSGSTYSGGTQLIGGTLQVGVANFFPAGSNLTINYGTAFDIARFNQSFGTVSLIDGSLLNSGPAASVTANTYDVRKGSISANLAGTSALTKTTSGTVTITGANSYSGGTILINGTLVAGATNTLPVGGLVSVADASGTEDATLDIGAFNQSVGTLIVGSNVTNSGTITGTTGIITATTLDMRSGSVSAILAGAGVGLTKSAENSTVTLTGLNTYSGGTTIGSGGLGVTPTLVINSLANGGSPSAIGASSNTASNLVIGNLSRLEYNGPAATTDRLFTLQGNVEFASNGTGPVEFTNTGAIVGNGGVLLLRGSNADRNVFWPLLDTSVGGFTKGQRSYWVLPRNNTYTGPTTVGGFAPGALEIAFITNGGIASPIGASTSDPGNLIFTGGTLKYVGPGNSTNRLFRLQNGGVIESSGTGPLNFTNTGEIETPTMNQRLTLSGTNTGANIFAPVLGGSDGLVKDGTGNWTVTAAHTYTGPTISNKGKITFTQSQTTTSAVTANGGIIELAAGGDKVFKTTSMSASDGGRVDLKNNNAIVMPPADEFEDPQTLAELTAEVKSGRGNGSWTGNNGIGTSQPAAASGLTGIALALNSDLASDQRTTFAGQSVGPDDMLLMYTYMGDANLDGGIDGDDFAAIDAGFSAAGTKYTQGDFNYSGNIDADDYFIIDSNYSRQGAPFSASSPVLAGGVTAVPEPAAVSALGLAMLGLMRRRRRA